MRPVVIRRCGDNALGLEAALARLGIQANQVQRQSLEDGQVMPRISRAGAHLIITKGNVQAPVQLILHAPVLADRASQRRGFRR